MSDSEQPEIFLTDNRPDRDERLYVPHAAGWSAHIKKTGGTERCFAQHPGQDFFHLIVKGEIYLENGGERYCLTCAMRRGILSRDRMYWQIASQVPTIEPLDEPEDFSLERGADV